MTADGTSEPMAAAANDDAGPQTSIYDPPLKIPPPGQRPLKAFAYDPSRGRRLGNSMTVSIHYEKLAPGPIGDRFAVVDYDGAEKIYYAPVDLDDPSILIQGGLDPS